MDDFERRLKALPRAKPSPELGERIFDAPPDQWRTVKSWRPRVAVGAGAVIAVAACLAVIFVPQWITGMRPGIADRSATVGSIQHNVNNEGQETGNFLDFTNSGSEFLRGALTVETDGKA